MSNVNLYPVHEFHTSLDNYQMHKLNEMLSFVLLQNDFYKQKLAGIKLPIHSKGELSKLPFTAKEELIEDQDQFPPYGNNHSYPTESYVRYHQTSGTTGKPLKVLDTAKSWDWWENCWVEVFNSCNVTSKDRIFLAFSFGPFVGFWGGFEAANKIGALAIPGGSQSSKQRLKTIQDNQATVLLCTPSYALYLIETAEKMDISLTDTPINTIITAGEPGGSVPSIRRQIENAWGAKLYDHVGMTEMGAYGYGCSKQNGLHVNDTQFIAEIINPDTLEPAEDGEKGELVLTNLGRYGYPLIRYRTGDIVKKDPSPCGCGNPYTFLPGGLIGRADDMVVIRGINIYPSSIESIVREFAGISEFRIVYYTVNDMDQIKVQFETDSNKIKDELAAQLRQRVGLRINTEEVEKGKLERFEMKGKRVIDQRYTESSII